MGPERARLAEELVTVTSPFDPAVEFTILKGRNRERIIRQNQFAKLRFIQREGSEEVITEREVPMGDIALSDIELFLRGWNLTSEGKPLPVNRKNILDYLTPEEFDWLYEQIRLLNPVIFGMAPKDAS
jgi:hypothetical protein